MILTKRPRFLSLISLISLCLQILFSFQGVVSPQIANAAGISVNSNFSRNFVTGTNSLEPQTSSTNPVKPKVVASNGAYTNWHNYTNTSDVFAIAIYGNVVWLGTAGGLVKLDAATGNILAIYHHSDGLVANWTTAVAVDSKGNIWTGSFFAGTSKFDGTNWTSYNTTNSGLASNNIAAVAADSSSNNIWFATNNGFSRMP